MAKSAKTVPQAYPRIDDDRRKDYGCLDDSTLVAHPSFVQVAPKAKRLVQSESRLYRSIMSY